MKKIIFTLLLTSSLLVIGQEKDDKGTFTLSGTVDVYGTTNFTSGPGTPGILIANPGNANAFGLGFANTIFAYEKGKAGVVADLAFGPRANDANLAGAINQLYVYYKLNDKFTLTAGQFNTFLGYEVISPSANFHYTVSYLFNAGPFSHTGVKLNYAASEDLSFLLAVTNAHALTSSDGNFADATQLGAQIGYKGQYLNFISGSVNDVSAKDWIFLDYTGGFDLSETFYVGINGAYANSNDDNAGYKGVALYLQNKFSDKFSLGFRPEFFTSTAGGVDSNVSAFTLTSNVSLTENLKFITDLRFDSSKDGLIEAFPLKDNTSTLTLAAVYSF
jgi:hypothetical protein